MAQKFSLGIAPLILIFAFIQCGLIFGSGFALLRKQSVLRNIETFCIALLAVSAILLLVQIIRFSMTVYHTVKEEPCENSNLEKEKNKGNIILAFLQSGFGILFCLSGVCLALLTLLGKIKPEKAVFFGRILCGIFFCAIVFVILSSTILTIVGYCYSRSRMGSDKEVFLKELKERSNKVINTLNFFHGVSNFLLSLNLYSCNLPIFERKFISNQAHFSDSKINVYRFFREKYSIRIRSFSTTHDMSCESFSKIMNGEFKSQNAENRITFREEVINKDKDIQRDKDEDIQRFIDFKFKVYEFDACISIDLNDIMNTNLKNELLDIFSNKDNQNDQKNLVDKLLLVFEKYKDEKVEIQMNGLPKESNKTKSKLTFNAMGLYFPQLDLVF